MKTSQLTSIVLSLSTVSILPLQAKVNAKEAVETTQVANVTQPKVQIAILLDTSSSMSGLIEQAKSELWSIVNTFNSANKEGKAPYVEVALYEYGKQSLNAESHWQRCIVPFSRDLDRLSEELFKLKTNGGQEYCGVVIQRAVSDMSWDTSAGTYKAIFIAGNEPFTQGPINVTESCQMAKKKGVVVNTIFCGNQESGVNSGWNIGPVVAGGSLLNIDHNAVVEHVVAPQDKVILQLNVELNKTYIPYGASGWKRKKRQEVQDVNAEGKPGTGASVKRAVSKASHNYCNTSWDLVGAAQQKNFDWKKVNAKELPKQMQQMTADELKQCVQEHLQKRNAIQQKIQQANKERLRFIQKVQAEKAESSPQTLDKVVTKTVREQAEARGYRFK